MFTAEPYGIFQILQTIYNHSSNPHEIVIFCDSKAAIDAVLSASPSSEDCIIQMHNLLSCLKSSRTAVSIAWIPSYVGIKGNKKLDNLASRMFEPI